MTIKDKYITVNYTAGRGGKLPIRITLHTCVCNAESLYSWFNTSTTKASTSFYVNKVGIVERYVRDTDTAWGNSNWDSNQRSFSIETWDGTNPNDSVRTNELYNNVAELVAYLCKTYQIPCSKVSKTDATDWNVKGIDLHNYFANKSCPASLDVDRIIKEANLILNPNPMNPQIAHDGSNLLGYKMSDEMVIAETKNLQNVFGGSYGKWYETFRNNTQCLEFNVDDLNTQIQALTNTIDEKNKLILEMNKTIEDQKKVIADQLSTITELNRTLDMKDEQIKSLEQQLSECQAGQKPNWVINIFGLRIFIIKRK